MDRCPTGFALLKSPRAPVATRSGSDDFVPYVINVDSCPDVASRLVVNFLTSGESTLPSVQGFGGSLLRSSVDFSCAVAWSRHCCWNGCAEPDGSELYTASGTGPMMR